MILNVKKEDKNLNLIIKNDTIYKYDTKYEKRDK